MSKRRSTRSQNDSPRWCTTSQSPSKRNRHDEDLDSIEDDLDDENSELLGIYRGVALTERSHDAPLLPDEIAVFRGPINRVTQSRRDAVDEIRETVIHELGHYFGLHDHDMPD